MPVALGIAARAAIPQSQVQVPVRSKDDRSAIVVGVRLADEQELLLAASLGAIGVLAGDGEAGNHRIPVQISVVDIKQAVLGICRVKSQPQQALLVAAAAHPLADIQKGLG